MSWRIECAPALPVADRKGGSVASAELPAASRGSAGYSLIEVIIAAVLLAGSPPPA